MDRTTENKESDDRHPAAEERRWAERPDFLTFIHHQRAALIKSLPKRKRILDCGGAGYPLCIDYPNGGEIICINTPDEQFYGHDFEVLNQRYAGRETFVRGDAQAMDFPGSSFDMVFAGQLIEHLPEPERFVAEAHRVLRPGGLLVVDTPNGIVTDIINGIVRRQTKDDSWFHGKEVGHIREFRPDELAGLIRGHGFRTGKIRGIYADLGTYLFRKHWPSRMFYLSKTVRTVYAGIGRFLPAISYLLWLEAEKV